MKTCIEKKQICRNSNQNRHFKTVSLKVKNQKVLPCDTKYEEVLFLWLKSIRHSIKEQTYATYYHIIKNHISKSLGEYRINEISTMIINQFINEKSSSGNIKNSRGLSLSYLKMMIYIIKASLNFANEEGFKTNKIGKIYIAQAPKREINIFTEDEIRKLVNYLKDKTDTAKLGILLTLNTGLRLGEICSLKWEDFNFDEECFEIRRTVERIRVFDENSKAKTTLVESSPKTYNSCRVIPIPGCLINMLLAEKENALSEYVIYNSKLNHTDPRTYQYKFSKYLDKCEIRKLNFHALRHTFATRCINSGVDLKSLSEILGHSDVSITLNVYVHSSIEQKKIQLEKMWINN